MPPKSKTRAPRNQNHPTRAQIQKRHTLATPSKIQAFPPFILSHIFLLASHSGPSNAKTGRIEENDTVFLFPLLATEPCTFTRVCKSWRSAALSTRSLWSHIVVKLGVNTPPPPPVPSPGSEERHAAALRACQLDELHQPQHLRMVSTWLRLSRDAPLYLYFSARSNPDGREALPSDLLASAPRWEVLHLSNGQIRSNDGIILHKIISDILPGRATRLNRLHIGGSLVEPIGTISLSRLPKLEYLSGPVEISIAKGRAHELSSLRGYMGYAHCHDLIARFPKLTELDVELDPDEELYLYTGDDDSTWRPSANWKTPIERSTVRTLAVSGEIGSVADFLCDVSLPSVQSATFNITKSCFEEYSNDDEMKDREKAHYITNFLDACSSSLTTLRVISDTIIEDRDVTLGIKNAANLTQLSLYIGALTDTGLMYLTSSLNADNCPNLTSLTIHTKDASSVLATFRLSSWSSMYSRTPPSFSIERLVQTVRSRFEKNKDTTIDLQLQVYTGDIAMLKNNVELQELQKQYRAFTLKIIDAGKKYSEWDEYGLGLDDEGFGFGHSGCAFDSDYCSDDGW